MTLLLAGCAATPSPPPQLYQLRLAPPEPLAAATITPPATPAEAWQLILPVQVPEYLDRDALLLPTGQAGLQPLGRHRWAEPLRDALPRLLRADLAAWRGAGSVWLAPLPPGLAITRELRVELLAFEALPDRSGVHLRARWSLTAGGPAGAPAVHEEDLTAASTGPEPDALVAAHRLALWRLAQRIATPPR
ncbi:MAG: PqiC family protein [Burkholderiales bacterium]